MNSTRRRSLVDVTLVSKPCSVEPFGSRRTRLSEAESFATQKEHLESLRREQEAQQEPVATCVESCK